MPSCGTTCSGATGATACSRKLCFAFGSPTEPAACATGFSPPQNNRAQTAFPAIVGRWLFSAPWGKNIFVCNLPIRQEMVSNEIRHLYLRRQSPGARPVQSKILRRSSDPRRMGRGGVTPVIGMVNFGGVPMADGRRTMELMSARVFPKL